MASRDEDLKIAQDASFTGRATTSAQNRTTGPGDKLENDLELRKDSKVSTTKAEDVAGRKGKGTGLGFLEKLVPGKHGKDDEK